MARSFCDTAPEKKHASNSGGVWLLEGIWRNIVAAVSVNVRVYRRPAGDAGPALRWYH